MPCPPDSTRHWLDAARAGDEEGFARLFEHLAPALHAWAELRIHPPQRPWVEPSDVVQEVWLRAWRALPRFEPDAVPFRPWLFRIAKNVLLEAGRQVARARSGSGMGPTTRLFALENLPDTATAISRRLVRDEGLAAFAERVRELEDAERKLVVHCGLEGLTHREVATRLGLSTEAVTKRWQRLRARLEASGLPQRLNLEGAA